MTTQQATKELIDKTTAGADLGQDDLELLKALAELEEAPEPEPDDKIISKGDDKNPSPMVRTKTTSAGYVYLRRNTDGQLRHVSKNNLAMYLKQKLVDGRPAWLPPSIPWAGRAKTPDKWCVLSAKHPDRVRMDDLNLPLCTKQGKLMGPAALRRHMIKKHKDDWDSIQRDEEMRRQDVRDAREIKTAEALTAALESRPRRAKNPKPLALLEESVTVECEVCSETFEAKARVGAQAKLRAHKKRTHPENGGS